jgi:outer membrane protein
MKSRPSLWISAGLMLGLILPSPVRPQKLTLDQAVALAREQSPTALVAQQRVAEASARVKQAQATLYPMLQLTSSYVRSDNPVQAFMFGLNQGEFSMGGDFNNPPAADNWQTSAQVQYRLFAGGRDLATWRAAQAGKRGAAHFQQAVEDELALQVIRSYLAVLTAREFVRAGESAVRDFQAGEKVMASRVEAGAALKTGLLEIQVQLAQAEERLLQAQNSLALAREAVRLSLGLDSLPFTEFNTLDELDLPQPEPITTGERPEILARTAMLEASRAELRAAKGGYLPALSAFASFDRHQGREFDGSGESWTAGLMLEWSLFDGFLTPGRVREKRAQVRMAEQEERSARLQTSVESTTARLNLENATRRQAVMDRAVKLASEHVELARRRFEQGLMLPSEVIDAENALFQAEAGLAQAKADRHYAIAALRRASGMPIIGETNHE